MASYDFAGASDVDVRASSQRMYGGFLVAGTVGQGGSGDRALAVARFDYQGAIDATFGANGWSIPSNVPANLVPLAVFEDNYGNPTVVAQSASQLYFVNLSFDGQGSYYTTDYLPSTFGMPVVRSIAKQPDGNVLVVGTKYESSAAGEAFVSRYSSGYLDSSFGNFGRVSLSADPAHLEGQAVAQESDGSIVLAASNDASGSRDMVVAHLSPSGVLDTAFGQNGIVTADNQGYDDVPSFIAMDWAGRILVAGTSRHVDGNGQSIGELFLWRMSTQGVDDSEFGAQSGTPGRFITGIPISTPGDSDTQLGSVAFDTSFLMIGATVRNLATNDTDFGVMRLVDNATADTSFGNCDGGLCGKYVGPPASEADTLLTITAPEYSSFAIGKSATAAVIAQYSYGFPYLSYGTNGRAAFQPITVPQTWMDDVALQPDGKIVALGWVSGESFVRLGRFNTDGSLDTTFGVDGFAVAGDIPGGLTMGHLAVQPDGKFLVTDIGSFSSNVWRLMPDGSKDLSWNGTGVATVPGAVRGLALQADGKLVAALDASGAQNQVRIARLDADGTTDASFGTNGSTTLALPPNSTGENAGGMRIAADGSIFVAGTTNMGGVSVLTAFKLLPSGMPDPGWGAYGGTALSIGSPDQGLDIQPTDDGRVLVVGACFNRVCLVRFNPNGSVDGSFGGGSGFEEYDSYPAASNRGNAIALDGFGQIYIASDIGYFQYSEVGRVLPDGSLDATFGPHYVNGWSSTLYAPFVAGKLQPNGNYLLAANDLRSWIFASYQGGIDTTPPETALSVTPASSPTSQTTATATFSSSKQDSTFQCALDGAAFTSCSSPATVSGLADGSHTYQVRAIDLYGDADPTPASYTWTVDTTAPDTSLSGAPSGTTTQRTASIALSSNESPVTFECSLDGAAFAACTSPVNLSGLVDGAHTFQSRAKDGAGNVDATPASATWTVDATAPDTTISGAPTGATSQNSATIALSSNDSQATYECALDGAAFAACTSPVSFSSLADGSHTFQARAKDVAGNVDATPASATWTVDTTAPDTSITSAPSGTIAQASATFTFSATEPGTFECKIDGAAFAGCTSPATYNGLTDGGHTFQVRARDAVGNVDATPASASWAVDTTPPETSITSAPSGTVASASASIAFGSTDGSATFQCSLDGASFAACANPVSLSGLADGTHAFQVRAIDAVGNVDATPASASWSVDTTAPDTAISVAPASITNQASATFQFGASESGDAFQCSLDGGAFAACSSPASYSGLADGTHTFAVRAIDAVGNTDASPASYGWTVDTVAPDTAITSGPSGKNNPSTATFAFTSTEGGSTFQCQLDGAAFVACASPTTYSGLVRGSHTFNVRAIDVAGNVDGTPATRTWSSR